MDALNGILKLCNSCNIELHPHRACYQTPKEYMVETCGEHRYINGVSEDIRNYIESNDCLIEVRVYPWTPIGFYTYWGYDIEKLLDEVHKELLDLQRDLK